MVRFFTNGQLGDTQPMRASQSSAKQDVSRSRTGSVRRDKDSNTQFHVLPPVFHLPGLHPDNRNFALSLAQRGPVKKKQEIF